MEAIRIKLGKIKIIVVLTKPIILTIKLTEKLDIFFWFKGIELYWKTVSINSTGGTDNRTSNLFYPIRRFKFKVRTFLKWNWLKYVKHSNPKRCVSCSEGIATLTILDPNKMSEKMLDPNNPEDNWDVCSPCSRWIPTVMFCDIDYIKNAIHEV